MPRISVGVRVRPLPPGMQVDMSLQLARESSGVDITASGLRHEFNFDAVFAETASQAEVFDRCALPIVRAAAEGKRDQFIIP